ncbi:hypothetical protein GpartN1_g6267.t1 [Galdieria partita]|uniref:Cytochrome b5 heme-binding domain-containing protein n=1 Tax=Galdieria partita TaxID=83374 RepID=A0A9C7Q2W3_9RHOD|nr:hypothetical protein GpartN1_g6267.t1 [Galdieria partita]
MLSAIFALIVLILAIYFVFSSFRRESKQKEIATGDKLTKPSKSSFYSAKHKFTSAEVSFHNHRDDLWLVIDRKVYDFTSFVEDHPGGDAILRYAGGDATVGFKGPQHPARVWDMIPEYFIGELESP